MGALQKTAILCILPFIVLYVGVPTTFYLAPRFMQHTFFLNFVRFPFTDYNNLTLYGVLSKGRNFYLNTDAGKDSLPKLGVWHILPESLSAKFSEYNATDEEMERSLDENHHSIVVYLHGNSFDRTTKHRCELYNVLSAMDFHILAMDYRGYGDSTGYPDENGLIEDAHTIYNYARRIAPSKNIFIWGHSMGTGVAARTVAELSAAFRPPTSLVLESPFNNLEDVVRGHPFSQPIRMMPFGNIIIDKYVIEPLENALYEIKLFHFRVTCPVLVLHAQDDHIISVELARRLVANTKAAQKKVTYVEFEARRGFMHKYIHRAEELPQIIRDFFTASQMPQRSRNRVCTESNDKDDCS
ncbi:serine aminopeptidase, s33 domain-containing protein [Ditylenchus destructor]|nr:serine aminopeptidase, s33 domain-containing protein [Ditylenchus destructor]